MKAARSLAFAVATAVLASPAMALAAQGEKKLPVALIGAFVAILGGLVAVFAQNRRKPK